jgi:hypothetical protein
MSLLRAQRWSRLVAMVLLVAMTPGVPHLALDDVACVPGGAGASREHDETQHGLRAGGQEEQDHCAICHWTRLLRSPRADVAGGMAHVTPPSAVHGGPDTAHVAPDLDSLPARAPPPALL